MSRMASTVIGWDIGGVNTKVSRVSADAGVLAVRSRPYEIQRDLGALPGLLTALAGEVGATPDDAHAVTMTAELSQAFRTKREGVGFVLDGVATAFPDARISVYTTDGRWMTVDDARDEPLAVAAANWVAAAQVVGAHVHDAILVDIGSTTTDIIPVVDGQVAATGRTDPARLLSGELLYLGALRTPVEAIVHAVPLGSGWAGVSAEGFALAGDVYIWTERLKSDQYTVTPPDGRPPTRPFAGERLARVVCADREMLDSAALDTIAAYVADAQVARTAAAIERVHERHPSLDTGVVAGLGSFIAEAACQRVGLRVQPLAELLGPDAGGLGADAAECAPATAVALLLART
jgi:(4-(4-[2-(gamma-L-glutamylamino)ethyl]phenoxymethyl)furan-2-yl)methanamine synthase